MCEELGTSIEIFRSLIRRGLLCVEDRRATPFGALHAEAAARLREDDELRARVAALALDLDTLSAEAPELAAEVGAGPNEAATSGAPMPSGLELLERVRSALEDSAEFLQEQGDDQARQLAQELAALQAALPDLTGPRLPFVRPAAGATAAT